MSKHDKKDKDKTHGATHATPPTPTRSTSDTRDDAPTPESPDSPEMEQPGDDAHEIADPAPTNVAADPDVHASAGDRAIDPAVPIAPVAPSTDPKPSDPAPAAAAAEPEPAPAPEPEVLEPGNIWVDIEDGGTGFLRVQISERFENRFSIRIADKSYNHVSEAADGTWQYRKD